MPHLTPDPDDKNLKAEIIDQGMKNSMTHALRFGPFTSAEIHRNATLQDLLHSNDRTVRQFGPSSPEYYPHRDDPDWAMIFDNDLEADGKRGRMMLEPMLQ